MCFVINHCRFEENGRRRSLYPLFTLPPSRPVAFAPHLTTSQRPRSAQPPLNLYTQQHPLLCDQRSPGVTLHTTSTQTPSIPPPDIPPAASPLSTCCPGDSIAAETTLQPCAVAVHMCVNVCRCGRGQSRSQNNR